jgi:hypothetical protein
MLRTTYSTVMKTTETKGIVIIVAMLSGALITAALAAFDFWIFTYTDDRSGFLGEYSAWALFAAMFGAVGGFIAGGLLGFFLSIRRRGPLFGALAGAIEGLVIAFLLILRMGGSTGDERGDLTLMAFVPIGALSGFLTSLIVSAMTSPAKTKERTYGGVLGIQQNKGDENRR